MLREEGDATGGRFLIPSLNGVLFAESRTSNSDRVIYFDPGVGEGIRALSSSSRSMYGTPTRMLHRTAEQRPRSFLA